MGVKDVVESCVKVSVATALGGPAVGAGAVLFEVAKHTADAIGGEEARVFDVSTFRTYRPLS